MISKKTIRNSIILSAVTALGSNECAHATENGEKIPAAFVSLSNSKNDFAILVEKSSHKLSLYRNDDAGHYTFFKSYPAITGKKEGDKKVLGDKKTPEGIYFATQRLLGRTLPDKYGPGAFTLDYPNVFDELLQKSGYGIWIHGVQNNKRILSPMDTEGCVALRNPDWIDLQNFIKLEETPVVITNSVNYFSSKKEYDELKDNLKQFITSWKSSWEQSDFESYGAFYSEIFNSSGLKKDSWINIKKGISNDRKNIKIDITDLKFVINKDQMIATFNQSYASDEKRDNGTKYLYLKKEDDSFKIIKESWKENILTAENTINISQGNL